MAKRSKTEKLAEAQVAADQPFHVTDTEFGELKLREGFVAAQVITHLICVNSYWHADVEGQMALIRRRSPSCPLQ